jgi:hypothetical protein
LGQPDLTKRLKNTTSRDLNDPSGKPFVDASGSVWIADRSNERVLRFSPDLINPVIKIATKIPKSSKLASLKIKGTATDASGIKSVQYRLGKGALKTASGTTSWSLKVALKKGKNAITLITTDTVGNASLPTTIKVLRR